ncbi:MAG: glycosyltransferase family 4 protein [Desulfomonilaceae bacterium]
MCPKLLQKQLKIVIISDWFGEDMGYSENMLPKAMAQLGHEVHLVTSNGKPYFTSYMYDDVYAPVFGTPIVDCYVRKIDGVTVHRLPHCIKRGKIWIKNLYDTLQMIQPNIVQVFEITPLTTLYCALWCHRLGFQLFSESRIHASTFVGSKPDQANSLNLDLYNVLDSTLRRGIRAFKLRYQRYGILKTALDALKFPVDTFTRHLEWQLLYPLVLNRTTKCYPLSDDVFEILVNHFKWPPQKLRICPLGVDTSLFRFSENPGFVEQRDGMRHRLGFKDEEIVCIYTGRFTEGKDPLCLALAVDELVKKGLPFRGLFVGSGAADYVEKIQSCKGCVIHPFVPVGKLPDFYRAADIGVWPRQESTSQLDAMACGLPLVLSDRVKARERISANAVQYSQDDPHSLALAILSLQSLEKRKLMGKMGADRVKKNLSWTAIAALRIEDYQQSLASA